MGIVKLKDRIDHFDYLVQHKMTGSPQQCANKLRISKSHFYTFLEELKALGIPVRYSQKQKQYEYFPKGKITFGFTVFNTINRIEMEKIKGGNNFLIKTRACPYILDRFSCRLAKVNRKIHEYFILYR